MPGSDGAILSEDRQTRRQVSSYSTTPRFSAQCRGEHPLVEFTLIPSRARAYLGANHKAMATTSSDPDQDIVVRGVRYTKEHVEDFVGQAEEYVRENPGQALLYAFVAGYILNRLPLGGIVRGLVRLVFLALRPAVLVYGASRLYQAAQEEE